MKAKRRKGPPTVTVDPKTGKFHPLGKIHAGRKSRGGFVTFHALAPCTVLFTNPSLFGRQFTKLAAGDNKRSTRIEHGHTLVMVAGRDYRIPRSLGAAGQPTDIIVP